jgi:hypothetical protein
MSELEQLESQLVDLKKPKRMSQKERTAKFAEKHDIKNTRTTCDICGSAYTYYAKSKHMKCKKHLLAMQVRELEKKINDLKQKS